MTRYAQKRGLRGFLTNKPYPDMPRWKRALLMSTSFGRTATRIAWALKNRQHGTEDPILRPKVQSSAAGNPIPRVYGRMRMSGQIIWATPIGGFRSFSNGAVVEGPVGEDTPRFVSLAIGLCRGPIDAITRIWVDGALIFDASSTGGYTFAPSLQFEKFFYLGTSSQEVDEWMEQVEGTGNVPAYRHRAYVVFKNFPLFTFGNNVPNFEFEVVSSASAAFISEAADAATEDIPSDNWVLSRLGPYIYGEEAGILSKYNRATRELVNQRDLAPVVEGIGGGSASLYGRLLMDEQDDNFYLLCQDGSSRSFIIRWGWTLKDNFSDRTPASEVAQEVDGIVLGGFLYTVDDTDCTVRRYFKDSLVRDWSSTDPALAGLQPGNLTVDDHGALWFSAWDAGDDSFFILVRCTQGGQITTYEHTTRGRCKYVAYDASFDWLLAGGDTGNGEYLVQVYTDPGANLGTEASNLDAVSGGSRSLFLSQRRFIGGRFWAWDGSTGLYSILTSGTMESDDSANTASWSGLNIAGMAYDASQNAFWTRHDALDLRILFLQRYGFDSITVGTVISDLCDAAGLAPGEIDTSAITDVCTGYAVTSKGNARAAIEPLMDAFLLEARETDGVLEFLHRGGASVVTIDEDDLGAGPYGQPDAELVEEEITPEQLLPLKVEVTYLSTNRDYDEQTQHEKRREDLTSATGEVSLAFPIALSDNQARRLAQNLLYTAWVERFGYAFALPLAYLRLDAGDVVTLPLGSESLRVRLSAVELGADYLVLCTGVLDDANSYASVILGSGTAAAQSITHIPASLGALLDCALARDGDDGKGPYFVAAPDGDEEGWSGASLSRAVDGQTYLPLAQVAGATAIGEVTSTVAKTQAETWDETTSFTVHMHYGTLASSTQALITADDSINLAAIGNHRRGWELLNFATVVDDGNGRYTVSNLRRGRRGTEWVFEDVYDADGVLVDDYDNLGDLFVVLDFSNHAIKSITPQDSEVGQKRHYRISSSGAAISSGAPLEILYSGAAFKPYAPSHLDFLQVVDELPDYHMHLRWTRRSRVGGDLVSGHEVPLAEESEEYALEILDDDGITVLNTYTGITRATLVSGVNLQAVGGGTDQFVRASGSFITDGYIGGTHIEVLGFANAANNGIFKIVSEPTATILSVVRSDYSPANLVNEASGAGRTIEARQPGFIYTVAMQTADYGEPKNDIIFRVFQLSARVGRGYGGTRVIDSSEV